MASVKKRLLAGVLAIGDLCSAIAEGDGEAKLIAVDLFVRQRCLVAERSQRPTLRGFDEIFATFTAPNELLMIFASVAVETVPSVPTATGRTVGTTTDILVAAGSPPMLPSAVDESVTLEVPVPPEASTVLAAEAEIAREAIMQTARMRETIFLVFFIVMTPLIKIIVES